MYAVVFMDSCSDVTGKGQEVSQDFSLALWEVGLKDGHPLLGDPRASASLALNSISLCRPYCAISTWASDLLQPRCISLADHILTFRVESALPITSRVWILLHTFPLSIHKYRHIWEFYVFLLKYRNTDTTLQRVSLYWLDFMDIARSQ